MWFNQQVPLSHQVWMNQDHGIDHFDLWQLIIYAIQLRFLFHSKSFFIHISRGATNNINNGTDPLCVIQVNHAV